MAKPNDVGRWSPWAAVIASIVITPVLGSGQEPLVFRSEVDLLRIDLQVAVLGNGAPDLTPADLEIFQGNQRRQATSVIWLHNDEGAVVRWEDRKRLGNILLGDPLCVFAFTRQANEVIRHYLVALAVAEGDRDVKTAAWSFHSKAAEVASSNGKLERHPLPTRP